MTREELIDHLEHLAEYVKYSEDAPALREVIEMLKCSGNPNGSDTIYRQAAIDALCAVCGKACDKSEFVYNAPQDEQVILCPEHYCLCTLPPAQSEQRWISVSERLPEDGLYLVTTSKGQVQVHVFSHNGNSEEYWMRCNKAWMPLPEPYRGE